MARITPFVAALAVACLAAVAASSATPPPITQRSTGKTFRLTKGGTATLRLSNRWHWSDPTVSTKAVELTPVDYLIDPGFREWTIHAHKVGRATIRSTGKPSCSTCALATRSFHVTVVVAAAG
jgi:predicted secreted protein